MSKYVIMAYRAGDSSNGSLLGVFSTPGIAVQEAIIHRTYREGKYDHKLFIVEEDTSYCAEVKGTWVTGGKRD